MSVKDIYSGIKLIETSFGSVDRVNRERYVTVALGAIAASVTQLPTSPVNAPTNHWLLQHEGNVKRIFSELNEIYVFKAVILNILLIERPFTNKIKGKAVFIAFVVELLYGLHQKVDPFIESKPADK